MAVAVVTGAGRGFGREIARRLAVRDYDVLCTDIDEAAARATAEDIGHGAWARAHDVRDAEQHRATAADAARHGPLEVWVNNAGVAHTDKAWDHSDDEVRLAVEVNLLGVIHGSRAAIEHMRNRGAGTKRCHVINMGSMSSFGPVPGLAVYGATKHAVLGFTESLQGDLRNAGIPIACHVVCPDAADTRMVREHQGEKDAAILWSGSRLLTAAEVADAVVAVLDSKRLVVTLPRGRAAIIRLAGLAPRIGLRTMAPLRKIGERRMRRG